MSDVTRWQRKIKSARDYDAAAREIYARDRRYARGDSRSDLSSNLAGVYVDLLTDFLYSQNPQPQCTVSRSAAAPGDDALMDAARLEVENDGEKAEKINRALVQIGAEVAHNLPDDAALGDYVQKMRKQLIESAVRERFDVMKKEATARGRKRKALADTMEIVIERMWEDGRLKAAARAMTQTALTVGIGVVKASWQERTAGESAQTAQRMADLRDNMEQLRALKADDETADTDAREADIKRQMEALRGEQERVVARGYVVDAVQPEDFQVAEGYTLANYLDAPWIAERFWLKLTDAKAKYPGIDFASATMYSPRKPSRIGDADAGGIAQLDAKEADAFVRGTDGGESEPDWVACWEIWDATSGHVLTLCEGVNKWLREPWQPDATTRFYPFFALLLHVVDGQRHPQSYIARSYKLLDEYDRIATHFRDHRRRVVPKMAFNSSVIDQKSVEKLAGATMGEMVPIDAPANMPLGDLLHEVAYPQVNPMLYDDNTIMQKIERVWGAQEAMTGAVNTAKTATEAQIQASGFSARTTSRRDLLEDLLGDVAQYTAEVAIQNLSAEEVVEIAGPDSLWPEWSGPESLRSMIQIDIRAGSSGKPNTTADREAWSTLLPILQNGVVQIGQMRGSEPSEIADKLEAVLRMTGERLGDRLDFDQIIPQGGGGSAPMPAPGAPQAPNMPPAPTDPTAPPTGAVPNGPMNGALPQ